MLRLQTLPTGMILVCTAAALVACQASPSLASAAGQAPAAATSSPISAKGSWNELGRVPGRAQEAAFASDTIALGKRPALDTTGDPKAMASLLKGLATNEPKALFAPVAGLNLTGLEEAVLVFVDSRGGAPATLDDLRPYCYAWPRVPGDPEGTLTTLAMGENAPAAQAAWLPATSGQLKMGLELVPDGLVATVPMILADAPSGTPSRMYVARLISSRLNSPLSAMATPLTTAPSLSPELSITERNERLYDYLSRTAHPHDVRIRAAQRAVSRLIQEAAKRSATLPATLDQAERQGVASIIQVSHVSPEEADLVVEFDGVQAYRYTFKLDSGEVGRVISYYFAVHPMDAANVYAPEGQVKDPDVVWQPFAALSLDPPLTAWLSHATM